MKSHTFSRPTQFAPARPQRPFEVHSCPDLQTFKTVHGGDFCVLPEGHADCHPGFRPYRCANGVIVGVKDL